MSEKLLQQILDEMKNMRNDVELIKIQVDENTKMVQAVRDNQLEQRSQSDAVTHEIAQLSGMIEARFNKVDRSLRFLEADLDTMYEKTTANEREIKRMKYSQ
ncbi:hypothetical protein [Aneurinibacillus aneurinilyticus]|uniref:hypothetical protein n=1 Tax=Aneurinibacillus aneurinilyticus TaxID=1391 RepID=UPI0036701DD1